MNTSRLRMLTKSSVVTLRNGAEMPVIGFGVYQSKSPTESCMAALNAGFRHIDSARTYRNENEVCQMASEFQSRHPGNIWLTTKMNARDQKPNKTEAAIEESNLRASNFGQKWDLFLLHDPTAGPERRINAWKVLEQYQAEGKVQSIGVSNFSELHLQGLKDAGCQLPLVNQIELHPWLQQKPIVEYCKKNGIVVQAYCPLVRGERFHNPVLLQVAKNIGKTPAQVLIRWSLQKGYVPLPKSDTPERILENTRVFDFEIDNENMALLDDLDMGDAGACSWNPIRVP